MGLDKVVKKAGRQFDRAVIRPIGHNPLNIIPIGIAIAVPAAAPAIATSLGISTSTAIVMMGASSGAISASINHQNFLEGAVGGAIFASASIIATPLNTLSASAVMATGGAAASTITGGNPLVGAIGGAVGTIGDRIIPGGAVPANHQMATPLHAASVGFCTGAATGLVTHQPVESAMAGAANGFLIQSCANVLVNTVNKGSLSNEPKLEKVEKVQKEAVAPKMEKVQSLKQVDAPTETISSLASNSTCNECNEIKSDLAQWQRDRVMNELLNVGKQGKMTTPSRYMEPVKKLNLEKMETTFESSASASAVSKSKASTTVRNDGATYKSPEGAMVNTNQVIGVCKTSSSGQETCRAGGASSIYPNGVVMQKSISQKDPNQQSSSYQPPVSTVLKENIGVCFANRTVQTLSTDAAGHLKTTITTEHHFNTETCLGDPARATVMVAGTVIGGAIAAPFLTETFMLQKMITADP